MENTNDMIAKMQQEMVKQSTPEEIQPAIQQPVVEPQIRQPIQQEVIQPLDITQQVVNQAPIQQEVPVVQNTNPVVEEQPASRQEIQQEAKQASDALGGGVPNFEAMASNFRLQTEELNDELKAPVVTQAPKADLSDLLKNIKVDLTSVELSNSSEIEILRNQKNVFSNRRTMQVVACQSSYSAEMTGLRNQEIQNISDSNVGHYEYLKKFYKTIYNNVANTSVGKMDYVTWTKVTSLHDIETLLYGIYCQTFPEKNTYRITCPKCDGQFKQSVAHSRLIETRGREEEIYSKIAEVIGNVKSPEELINNSHVNTTKRVMLENSKIIFDIFVPSIYDYLEGNMAHIDEQLAEELGSSASLAIFVKQILMPDLTLLAKTGEVKFIPVTNKRQIIDFIANLEFSDGDQLVDEIDEFVSRLAISYSIKNVTCEKCLTNIDTIPINIEQQLFITIRLGNKG